MLGNPDPPLICSRRAQYEEAKQLLQNFIWLIVSPSLLGLSSADKQRQVQAATPLIFAFDKLFQAIFLHGSSWRGISPQQIWDADSSSRLRFTFCMIRDIELILELYCMIIRPFERQKIFWETYETNHPGNKRHILWSFYLNDCFPDAVLLPAKDPPNLVQAVNTIAMSFEADWRVYLSKDGHGLEPPPLFLCLTSPSGTSRKQEGAQPADQPLGKRQKTGSEQGKPPSHRQASIPLLQWAPDCPADAKNKAGISALLQKHHAAIPKVKQLEPNPATPGMSICFPFLIDGLGCKCQGRALKFFAHVDISDKRWKPAHISDLQSLLNIVDVAQMLRFTDRGATFLA